MTFGTNLDVEPRVSRSAGGSTRLVFSSVLSNVNIWSLPVRAGEGKVTGPLQQLTSSGYDAQSSVSDDGTLLAFISSRSGNDDVWLKNLENGRETALTTTPIKEVVPEITSDGSRVFYQTIDNWTTYVINLGTDSAGAPQPGAPEKICERCVRLWDVAPDGKKFLFIYNAPPVSLGLFDLATGERREVARHSGLSLYRARFSPDGRWLTFHSEGRPGHSRVTIVPLRDAPPVESDWIFLTGDDTFHDKPVWSPDGNLLYYTSDRDGFRCIRAQRLDPSSRRPVGPPLDVYHSHGARRSLRNVRIRALEFSVVRDKMVFSLGEQTGNLWTAEMAR